MVKALASVEWSAQDGYTEIDEKQRDTLTSSWPGVAGHAIAIAHPQISTSGWSSRLMWTRFSVQAVSSLFHALLSLHSLTAFSFLTV
jgi:hypothetical protein